MCPSCFSFRIFKVFSKCEREKNSPWVLISSTETSPVKPPLLITVQRETVVKLFVQLREEKYGIMCVDFWLVTLDETEELEDEDEEDFDDDDKEEEE